MIGIRRIREGDAHQRCRAVRWIQTNDVCRRCVCGGQQTLRGIDQILGTHAGAILVLARTLDIAAHQHAIAARIGRDRKRPLRRDWESVKDSIMREAVLAKFTQHADLREKLLGTGDAEIVEHTDRDSYWGDGGDGSGHNMLGRILMSVRDELRRAEGQS